MNQEIQQNITNLYNLIDDLDNTRDLLEIRYWLLNSNLGENNNYLTARFNIEKQKSVVTRHLTRLSESVDDLEIRVNRCKQLVLIEREKDPKFAKAYDKYYKKTPEVKYKAIPLIMSC
jgi:chromosome segregation ATPase